MTGAVKIAIISFYELKEFLLCVKKCFEQYCFEVINYPLFMYAYDKHDKIDNYAEHMNKFIANNGVNIVLWWFLDVPVSVFNTIKCNNKDVIFVMYNSDDPVNLTSELFEKAKIFDVILTPTQNSVDKYKFISGVDNVISVINGGKCECVDKCTWTSFVEVAVKEIGKLIFDAKSYSELYNLNFGNDSYALLQYWLNCGVKEKQVCYELLVPDNFDFDLYIKKYCLKNKVVAYIHWFLNDRGSEFVICDKMNVVDDELYFILDEIMDYDTKIHGIVKLAKYCDGNEIEIGKVINDYLNSVWM